MAPEDQSKKEEAQEEAGWEYKSAPGATKLSDADVHDGMSLEADKPVTDSVQWTASEFVAHHKNFGWYLLLVLAAAAIAAGIYFITRDVFSMVVVLIMATIFGVSGSHKPRIIAYTVDESGLTVGNKFYPYSEYKSFSMPQEGPFTTIALVPMKHFALPVGAYLAPDSQDKVLEIVSSHLPLEHRELGTVDHLMHHLRF